MTIPFRADQLPRVLSEGERAKGFEPSQEAWKAAVLPLHHARLQAIWRPRTARSIVFGMSRRRSAGGLDVEVCAHACEAKGRLQLGAQVSHGQRALLVFEFSLHAGNEANTG